MKIKGSSSDDTDEQGALAFPSEQSPIPEEVPDLLKYEKTIRVAVSGDVLITRLERKIVDTQEFQRMRGIRQLGTTCLVYPTALHTRFDHSLGTLEMVAGMIRAIRDNTHSALDERKIDSTHEALARLYALLHDITHIPFGHTLEDELGIFKRHDENPDRIMHFLGPSSRIGGLIRESLGNEVYGRLLNIMRWDKKSPLGKDDAFVFDLVSNTVCADLLDYLLRDNYFCDLGLSIQYRFLKFLYLMRTEDGQRRVFIRLWKISKPQPRRDILTDLVRLLEARYQLAERVYFHHAKIISGTMLGRAVQEAKIVGEISEDELYELGDETLLYRLRTCKRCPIGQRLANLLAERRLHKCEALLSREDFEGVQSHDHRRNVLEVALDRLKDEKQRREIENDLSEKIGALPGDVLLYAPSTNMNMKAAKMLVLWKGKPLPLEKIDDPVIKPRLRLVLDAHQKLWNMQLLVSEGLSDDQIELVVRGAKIELFNAPDIGASDGDEKIRYVSDLIELRLRQQKRKLPTDNAVDLKRLMNETARETLRAAREPKNRSWTQRMDDAIRQILYGGANDKS